MPYSSKSSKDCHQCNSLCEGFQNLPVKLHAQVLDQFRGEKVEKLKTTEIEVDLKSIRLVEGSSTDDQCDLPRLVEGVTRPAEIPLGLETTFADTPLPKGHARFLRVIGSGSHPLGFLEDHSLENAPPYVALSYCWGTDKTRRSMFLNGASFSVSAQVLEALNQKTFSLMTLSC